jgi:hypothetical protein
MRACGGHRIRQQQYRHHGEAGQHVEARAGWTFRHDVAPRCPRHGRRHSVFGSLQLGGTTIGLWLEPEPCKGAWSTIGL